jgi:hypothetical protein
MQLKQISDAATVAFNAKQKDEKVKPGKKKPSKAKPSLAAAGKNDRNNNAGMVEAIMGEDEFEEKEEVAGGREAEEDYDFM